MPNFQPYFDATNIPPQQGGAKHPVGKNFPAVISDTGIKATKNNDGGYFFVTFTTQAGQITSNYNIWNDSAVAVEIAQKQLSALLHAVGIFKIHCTLPDGSPDMQGAGNEIRNQRCQIDVSPQTKNPEYNEVSRIYDANGNEPGKAPLTGGRQYGDAPGAVNGGWNQTSTAAPQQAVQQAAPPAQGWAPSAPANAPAANVAPVNSGAWQPGPSVPASAPPPWATK